MNLRTLLSTAAAAAVLIATPVLAQDASGYVGASYLNSEIDTPLGDIDGDGWGVEGALATGTDQLGFQLNGAYTNLDAGGGDADSFDGTAHVFTRRDDFAFGGFVGYSDVEGLDSWYIGGEAAKHFEQVTLVGAVGYGNIDDLDADVWGVNVEGRFFATDNFRIDGRLGWSNYDSGFVGDLDAVNFGIGAEYQFDAVPVSVYAGFDSTQFDDVDVDVNTFTVGLRYNWGGSLKDRDRSGATFRRLGGFSGVAF